MNRIHINKMNSNHIILERLHKYYYKENKYTMFFSENGIFSLERNALYKWNFTDGDVIKRNNYFKDYNLWTDTTRVSKKNYSEQLPYEYLIKKVKEMHFRLHENATMTFCIELCEDEISDYYFLTNENIDNHSIKKDIVTFLSLLK